MDTIVTLQQIPLGVCNALRTPAGAQAVNTAPLALKGLLQTLAVPPAQMHRRIRRIVGYLQLLVLIIAHIIAMQGIPSRTELGIAA